MKQMPLLKPIEATRLHPRTGIPLGQPDVTIYYGALIEHVGSDHDREKFTYLGELYSCKRESFLSATGTAKSQPKTEPKAEPKAAPKAVPVSAPAPAAEPEAEPEPEPSAGEPRLEWQRLASSDYSVSRASVPGGWLVTLNGESVTFVPDPKHQWQGVSPE
jgi:hypothetical protein